MAININATAQFTANDIQRDDLAVEQTRSMNTVYALLKGAAFFLSLIVAVGGFYTLAKIVGTRPNQVDTRGNPLPMFDVLDGTAWDIDRAVNGQISTRKSFLKQLPEITAARQDAVTERDQQVDLRTRSAAIKRIEASMQRQLPDGIASREDQDRARNDMLPLPEWEIINGWDGTSLPLGLGRKGLITAQAASPHILISGKTGSGKTLYMMRTLATACLAKGHQLVNLGFSDSGYGVFGGHPNYHSLKLERASDIIGCLQNVYAELRARKEIIGGANTDWEHWQGGTPPRPFTQLMIDELGNLAEDVYVSEGAQANKELWRWVSMIANEGRKVGIYFVAALQDPTAKSVDLRFRRNCTLVSFQQGDASQSSAFLGATGAEQLQVGHFMARVDEVMVGGGFSPTDKEINDYLSRKQVAPTERPKWLLASTDKRIGADVDRMPFIAPTEVSEVSKVSDVAWMAEKIRAKWSESMSKSAVAAMLGYTQYGGSMKAKTDKVVEYLISTTTTGKQAGMGVFEAVDG